MSNPLYPLQWHLNNDGGQNLVGYSLKKKYADIGAEAAWTIATGVGVKVVIIEADIYLHLDFDNNIKTSLATTGGALVLNGALRNKNSLTPLNVNDISHGTSVTGIAGSIDNNIGNKGVAYNCELIPIQIGENFYDSDVADAILYALNAKHLFNSSTFNTSDAADVINMSFGSDFPVRSSGYLKDALEKAIIFGRNGKGILMVRSLSNANLNIDQTEKIARSKYILNVGRSGPNDQANGSPHGEELEFLVPGVDFITEHKNVTTIRSRRGRPKSYAPLSALLPANDYATGGYGTSWSAPVLSGVIALMLEANPNLTWVEVRSILRKTAHKIEIDNPFNDFKWKDLSNQDIVDSNQNLIAVSGNTTLSAPIVDPGSNSIRDLAISVSNVTGFQVGQAVMIGARTKLLSITDPFNFIVNDASSFSINNLISIGTSFSTSIYSTIYNDGISFKPLSFDRGSYNPPLLQNRVRVHSKGGLIDGQTVSIEGSINDSANNYPTGSETLIIQNVSNDVSTITFTSNRINDYWEQSSLRVLGKQSGLKIINISGNTITLDPSTPISDISKHPTGTLVEIEGTEIAFVKSIDTTNNKLITNKLQLDISIPTSPATIPVIGGRIPHKSLYHGHGRIDAYEAVREAEKMKLAMQVTPPTLPAPYYDLILRKSDSDDGFTLFSGTIDSPDIAVSHSSTPTLTGTRIDHSEPIANKDRYVHIQVQNKGSKSCLDAEIRLLLRVVPVASTPSFDFPDNWKPYFIDNTTSPPYETSELQTISSVNEIGEGIFLFDKEIKEISEGEIAPGASKIFTLKWPKKYLPPIDGNFDTYIMAMITPFDGVLTGNTVNNNNNICYKKVNIIYNILFKDSVGGLMLNKNLSLSAYSSSQTIPFAIEINNPTSFDFSNIELTIKQKNRKVTDEIVTFKYIGGVWKFDGATPSWITFSTIPATTSGTATNFVGTYKVTPEQKYVEISVKVYDTNSSPTVDFKDRHRLKIAVTDLAEIEDTSKGGSKMHFYTNVDSALLLQTPSQAFGPFTDPAKPTKDLFRITNLHSATVDPKVYSICDGLVCAQEIDASLVNLIVKPFT